MLSAFFLEVLGDDAPFGAVLLNQLAELLIFLLRPIPLLDVGIQIVLPLLAALLLASRVLAFGFLKQLKRHYAPIYVLTAFSKIKAEDTLRFA